MRRPPRKNRQHTLSWAENGKIAYLRLLAPAAAAGQAEIAYPSQASLRS
jgi:hypothetical protein